MGVMSRIARTVLIIFGALLILWFGLLAISWLYQQCGSSFIAGGCKAIQLALSSLLVFLTAVLAMRLTNLVWGRNLFKGRKSEA
jgi:hypothetical protein